MACLDPLPRGVARADDARVAGHSSAALAASRASSLVPASDLPNGLVRLLYVVFGSENGAQFRSIDSSNRPRPLEVLDLYADMREEHYAGLEDRRYLTLEKARSKGLKVDWAAAAAAGGCTSPGTLPWTPRVLGVQPLRVPIAELIPFIDWNPFFATWEVRKGGWGGWRRGAYDCEQPPQVPHHPHTLPPPPP